MNEYNLGLEWHVHSVVTPTFMPTADVALRRVTYEEMFEDWFNLSEDPPVPEGKTTDITSLFSSSQYSKALWRDELTILYVPLLGNVL